MEVSSSHQVYVFFIYVITGISCCAFFDLQRFIRRLLKAGSVRTLLEDLFFAILCATVLIVTGFLFNDGQMRYYQFAGAVSGALFYAAFLSGKVMLIMEKIYNIVRKILIKPIVKILKIIYIPFNKTAELIKRIFLRARRVFARLKRALKKRNKLLKKRIKML